MKVEFEGKTYVVKKPGHKEQTQAKLDSNKKFRECLESGVYYLRDELYKILRQKNYWDDERENEKQELSKIISDGEKAIKKGGIELSEAKNIALKVRAARYALLVLTAKVREFDEFVVETQVDNAHFDSLVASCCFDEEGNRIYSSYEDYVDRKSEELSSKLAEQLAYMEYGLDPDWQKKLPENEFLFKYGFVDEDLNLKIEESEENLEKEEEISFSPFTVDGNPVE